jgi:hypothetical protein
MLKDILVDCTEKPQESFDEAGRARLLDDSDCLMQVIPICDGKVKDARRSISPIPIPCRSHGQL